jgi:hypothetical protein
MSWLSSFWRKKGKKILQEKVEEATSELLEKGLEEIEAKVVSKQAVPSVPGRSADDLPDPVFRTLR